MGNESNRIPECERFPGYEAQESEELGLKGEIVHCIPFKFMADLV